MARTAEDLSRLSPDGSLNGASVFLVASGTKVSIVSAGLDKRQVEIQEGQHRGSRGWVPVEWIEK